MDFFSIPVITGFTIAAALNIAFTQLKSLLGVPGPANEFLETLESVVRNIKEVRVWDFVLGVVSMVVVIIFRVNITFCLTVYKFKFGENYVNRK